MVTIYNMKKLSIIILTVLISSCSGNLWTGGEFQRDLYLIDRISGHDLEYNNIPVVYSVSEVGTETRKLISPKEEPAGQDDWMSPSLSIRLGFGDCEEFAMISANIIYLNFDIKPDFGIVDYDYDGKPDHVLLVIDGLCFNGWDLENPIEIDIVCLYLFDEVFN